MTRSDAAVLAVDGGNSKTDLALVARDGSLIASGRGATISHQSSELGADASPSERAGAGMARLRALASEALAARGSTTPDGAVGTRLAEVAVLCLAGADFPRDVRLLTRAAEAERLARRYLVRNDAFAALRAGAEAGWGIALICGAGINAVGVSPAGRTAAFPAVGEISGDWGGSWSVGMAGLAAAVRARDGRGPRTDLERSVPAHFGLAQPAAVTRAFYGQRVPMARVRELSPVVFAAAATGDAVAREIVDRLADELAAMAVALGRRLGLLRRDVAIVLAGGVFRTDDPAFYRRLEERIHARMPGARVARLTAPPVLGAALLGLDQLRMSSSARRAAEATLRRSFNRS